MGKAYTNKKSKSDRPKGDYYGTPVSLLWELMKIEDVSDWDDILEPCTGAGNLSNELKKKFNVTEFDLFPQNENIKKQDFLEYNGRHKMIISNPPFSLFDDFVSHAKEVSDNIWMIGKTNFFGAHSRNINGIWKNLKSMYVFDRQVDYQTPSRDDGLFHVGNLVNGWFNWEKNYTGDPIFKIIDVQKYAKLGLYKSRKKK